MQLVQRQPQLSDTISDQITGEIQSIEQDIEGNKLSTPQFTFGVTPQMVDELGTISFGVLNEVIANVTKRVMDVNHRRNAWIEQVSLHYFHLIQLESELKIEPQILELGRRSAKLDINVFIENSLVAKAIVVCQVMERP